MSQTRCVRHTLEDQYGHVMAWQITPASNRPTWPDALQGAALMGGWVEKEVGPFWSDLPDQPTDPTDAATWQAIAARLYQAVVGYYRTSTDPELDARALAAMALYDSEVDWGEDDRPPVEHVKAPMPEQAEAYLG